eukprot:CAMPEP_0202861862 /NCGR_PEP_ID=MMETSP1391-20130828/3110_1 /ASSEMBLY_ACC=CAM_ASM_000867 /TAXON_ID=1034604 /ORGANISM="Chlamydomonas leiostraca, Strain SAG 11-49" /LENGTH=146 /DNA_ID=CAMNT_0049541303 /DNA_START=74 /DNA_END=515 /DNA_ORIENTATION=-
METAKAPVYVVLVTGKVKPGQMGKFKEVFKPLADHVTEHEDGCLSYQLSVSETSPDELCIFERYVSKEYLEGVHWQSEPFKKFGAACRELDLWEGKTVAKYWEEGPGAYGFMAAASDAHCLPGRLAAWLAAGAHPWRARALTPPPS